MYLHYIFFIHSPVDGHLHCFYILTIVNFAAMDIGVHIFLNFGGCISFWISVFVFFSNTYAGVELLGHMVVLFLVFQFDIFINNFFIIVFKDFFWCGPFLMSLLNLLQYCFCSMFWFSGREACGILAPWPGIKAIHPALEGKVLTSGLPGM